MVPVEKSFVNNMFSVEGKVALVTGATGALGCVLAKAYGYAGAKVFMTGRNDAKLKALENEFKAEGIDCAYFVADPAKEEDVDALVKACVAKYGEINILAVAHGYNKPQNVLEQSVADWQKIMDADCKSVYVVTKYVAHQMVAQVEAGNTTRGKMVIVTSQRSKRGMAGYTGAKQTKRALREGKAVCVYYAADADPALWEPVVAQCHEMGVPAVEAAGMKELGLACSIAVGAAVAALVRD